MSEPPSIPQRRAAVFQHGIRAGNLFETEDGGWVFTYREGYSGEPVSLTMPVQEEPYQFSYFPPPFEGLLPEGTQLDALLRNRKIDRDDAFGQLVVVGSDLVGSLTVEEEAVEND